MLWHCLSLEFLARAALTSVSPVLNADPTEEGAHILFALGFEAPKQPKSIPVHAVFSRLEKVLPDFKPHRAICDYLINLRNEEVHTGSIPFDDLLETWLAPFYRAVNCLCVFLGKDLSLYLGIEEAPYAQKLIESQTQEILGEVKKRIASFKGVFDSKSDEEKEEARKVAQTGVLENRCTPCPACGCAAVLSGDLVKEAAPVYEDGALLTERTYSVTSLQCKGCGITLKNIDEVLAAEVKPRFTEWEGTDLHEMHYDEIYSEYDNM